jgi:hypothetical protein
MFKTVEYAGWGSAAFFVTWVIVGKFTFLTLFLAVMMEAFESKYDAQVGASGGRGPSGGRRAGWTRRQSGPPLVMVQKAPKRAAAVSYP